MAVGTTVDILGAALALRGAGVSILPIDHRTKRPLNRLLPRDEDGKPVWEPYRHQIADERTVRGWFSSGAKAFAVIGGTISGNLLVLDFDVERFYHAWRDAVGDLAEGLPVQQTGGGGYQVFLRCPEPGENAKLAWVECETEEAGRQIAIETRGEGGYAIVPPSLHPSGNHYVMVAGDLTNIPTLPQVRADALCAAARKLDEAPFTRREKERIEREAHQAHQRRAAASRNGSADVIDQFNQAHAVEGMLEQYGYTKCGDRFIRPGGKSASVNLKDGRSCHFSSNDPLNDGRVRSGIGIHDAFDVFAHFEHGGDTRAAVKAAARAMGIEPAPRPSRHPGRDVDNVIEFKLTDLGNAQRLVRRHGKDFRYDAAREKWLCWDGRRWIEDSTGEAMRRAKESARSMWAEFAKVDDPEKREELFKHARRSEMRNGLESALRLAQSEPGIAVRIDDLDADPMQFNCMNGTIDLHTGQLRPHRREDLITKMAPVCYDPNAPCPRWMSFLDRILAGKTEMEQYLARIAGLSLTADASIQEMFIFHGCGANGKSIFLDTLTGLMGEYAGSAPDSLLTVRMHDEHPTEVADLFGRRLVVGSETEQGAKLRIQLIKRLTGNKTLKARYMRQDFFEFRRTHKLILVTNNRPVVKETTHAVWRRLRLVPFTVTIPLEERDTALLEKLQAEWPGILAWAVRGCLQWQKTGMQPPAEVLAATDAYQAEQNTLAEYLAENCMMLESGKVERTALFCDYQAWCKKTGEKDPLDKSAFYDRIRQLEDVVDSTERIGNAPKHVFKGICLCHSTSEGSYAPERDSSL